MPVNDELLTVLFWIMWSLVGWSDRIIYDVRIFMTSYRQSQSTLNPNVLPSSFTIKDAKNALFVNATSFP